MWCTVPFVYFLLGLSGLGDNDNVLPAQSSSRCRHHGLLHVAMGAHGLPSPIFGFSSH
jgi:hypothetical protein